MRVFGLFSPSRVLRACGLWLAWLCPAAELVLSEDDASVSVMMARTRRFGTKLVAHLCLDALR